MQAKSKLVILGMIICFLFLAGEVKPDSIPCCDIKFDMTPVPVPDPETLPSLEDIGISSVAGGPMRIMPLGDSITYGTGDSHTGGYRDDLDRLIDPEGNEINFVGSQTKGNFDDNHHEGYGGWKINQIEAIVTDRLERYNPDIVLLHIGTNDLYHFDYNQVDHAITHLNGIITKVFDYNPDIYLLVAAIIPWTSSCCAGSCGGSLVDDYNDDLYQLVSDWRADVGDHIRHVDHYNTFSDYPNWKSALMADCVHPNQTGYGVMAQTWYDHIDDLLGSSNQPPIITILEPDGTDDIANGSYTFMWEDTDPDDDAQISFYYDDNTNPGDGYTLIVSGISEDDETDSYLWDTSNLPYGDYYVYGLISDGINSASDYGPGPVTITHIPFKIEAVSPQPSDAVFAVELTLGEDAHPVSDILGLSFILNYTTPEFLQISEPIEDKIIIEPTGFMGSDIISTSRVDQGQGEIRIGLSRKFGDGGTTGYGRIVRLRFRLNPEATPGSVISFSLNEIAAWNAAKQPIELVVSERDIEVGDMLVWPGDTNNDGTVNEMDILPVGSCWLLTGPTREEASLNWEGQSASPWPDHWATYADANGDGIIDEREIVPVGLNWGRSHPRGHSPAPARTPPVGRNPYEAYRAIYRSLQNMPENEAVLKMKNLLAELLESEVESHERSIATSLAQNYPNPVSPETWFPFSLSKPSQVTIRIYNLGGELIKTLNLGLRGTGKYTTLERAGYWDGRDEEGREVALGVYLYQLRTGDYISTRKMIISNQESDF
ncbi:MAG: GDSL-type esterase/lipase family protein [bacterium]|nr:GDSL-type esterase/lipase family protein [bacterium]